MKIAIVTPVKTFLNILKAVGVAMQEASIVISKEGITFRGMGASHIDLIDVFYPASDFPKKYEVDEIVKFGIKVEDILKVVKRFGDGKKIEDEFELTITPEGEVFFGSTKKAYNTRVIAAEEGSGKLPEIQFDGKIIANRGALIESLDDIQLQSERVKFVINEDKTVTLQGRGDKGSAKSNLTTVAVEGTGATTYNLEFLSNFVNAVDEEKVTIDFGTNKPIRVTIGKISYFLSPMVEQ